MALVLEDLHVELPTLILIYCDNINSMQLVKNLVFHARMEHIEVHYQFACERDLEW